MLANLGETAEKNLHYDPHTTLMKLRLFGETLAKVILAMENIKEAYNTSQVDRIQTLRREGLLEKELYDMFDALRKKETTQRMKLDMEQLKSSSVIAYGIPFRYLVYGSVR